MSKMIRAVFCLSLLVLGSSSWAYYDVLNTGEILARGSYRLMGDLQLQTDVGQADVQATVDTGFSEDFGGRLMIGTGATDFYAGVQGKWIPIPDVKGQPAVGMTVGFLYGHYNRTNEMTFRWEPLVSKKFQVENMVLTPYGAVPIGVRVHDSESAVGTNSTDMAWQVAVGSQFEIEKWKNIQFIAEVGVSFSSHAPSYVTLGGIWYFDDQNGFQVK